MPFSDLMVNAETSGYAIVCGTFAIGKFNLREKQYVSLLLGTKTNKFG
jgi:hypothetical protein